MKHGKQTTGYHDMHIFMESRNLTMPHYQLLPHWPVAFVPPSLVKTGQFLLLSSVTSPPKTTSQLCLRHSTTASMPCFLEGPPSGPLLGLISDCLHPLPQLSSHCQRLYMLFSEFHLRPRAPLGDQNGPSAGHYRCTTLRPPLSRTCSRSGPSQRPEKGSPAPQTTAIQAGDGVSPYPLPENCKEATPDRKASFVQAHHTGRWRKV